MKPGTVQRICDEHFPAMDAARRLDGRSRWAAWNIRTCRTPAQGYHIDECPNGDYRINLNNSCKHRSCPLCGATETELWLERQSAKELAYLREGFQTHTATGKPKSQDQILVPPPDMTVQQCLNLFNKLGRQKWHVEIEPAYAYAGGVLKYAGRYIRRGPLSERGIRAYDGKHVTIAYGTPSGRPPHSAFDTALEFWRTTSKMVSSSACGD